MSINLGKAVLEILTDLKDFKPEDATSRLGGLAGASKDTMAAISMGAAAAAAAVAAIAAGVLIVSKEIIELGQRGAAVADVRDAFEGLSASVGESGDRMLGALREGTRSTISDFELMKAANKAMGAGLVATAGDFEVLAGGAKMLADRTGGDTVDAFDTLTSAMASGRTAALKQLGLFIDSKAAIADYARAHRMSVSDMTDADRAAALQAATIAQLRQELGQTGEKTTDFGDRVDQLKTRWENFKDALAEAVANSPVINAALETMGLAVDKTFGTDSQEMVRRLIGYVNDFAIGVVKTGQIVLDVGAAMVRALGPIADVNARIAETAAMMPFAGAQHEAAAKSARTQADAVKGVVTTFETLKAGLDNILPSMIAARDRQNDITAASNAGRAATQRQIETELAARQRQAEALAKAAAQAEEYRAFQDMLGEREIEMHARIQAENQAADEAYRAYKDMLGEREIERAQQVMDAQREIDEEYRAYQDWLGQRRMEQEAAYYQSATEKASALGFHTRAELEKTAATALATYQAMKESGEFTAQVLEEAWTKYETARRAAAEETHLDAMSKFELLASSASSTIRSVFGKNKAAAIAAATIDILAGVVKSFAQYGWPWGLVPAAAITAAGLANIAKIRSTDPGFRFGTPNLDFMTFGPATQTTLHGDEAVIPRGSGHELAGEIAMALARRGGAAEEGGQTVVTIDARGAFLNRLSDMHRLAQRVERAVSVNHGLTTRFNPA